MDFVHVGQLASDFWLSLTGAELTLHFLPVHLSPRKMHFPGPKRISHEPARYGLCSAWSASMPGPGITMLRIGLLAETCSLIMATARGCTGDE